MRKRVSDTIKFLSVDMIQKANSGHPGAPMGLSDIMSVFMEIVKHNPKNPNWLNRDRVVFSGGHASALIYSYLYLSGYDISMDDLKNFRQLHSKTPGHPEIITPGVEIATGPLGQGIANAVGFAMAAKYAQNLLNDSDNNVIDHKVYCFCGDGDLQEGISYEACCMAGLHKLDNLVLIYDSNNITIEGHTNLAWCEDVKVRFEAQGFEVARIDGHNFDEIDFALKEAKNKTKPYLIIANTVIAKGALELEGSHNAHGSPLGEDLIKRAKKQCGLDENMAFLVDDEVLKYTKDLAINGQQLEQDWNDMLLNLSDDKKDILNSLLNPDFSNIDFPNFDGKKIATRDSNGQILNAISNSITGFIGGSADLGPSNKTTIKNSLDFPFGKNIHFGIREHSMAAITNAFARYGLFIPFCATFFIFSDYLKCSARLAALMGLKNYFIFTHDSIGVGEDGPTHEPIEQLSTLRNMPNFYSFRPADGVENVKSWQVAFTINAPCAFICSRQSLEPLCKPIFGDVRNGAYMIKKTDKPSFTLVASGSEVSLCLKASEILENMGFKTNVVSAPCFDILCEQDREYIDNIFDKNSFILAVEAASALEWYKFADEIFSMKTFGQSAKACELFEYFGFTPENIANFAIKCVNG